ncbi:GNAT family N-acetyltransferase [Ruoffia sp. FAM 20857]|uniref:GNAT family N-acetyltransferase n=1 Tax=Ruoffia sp. FAM 20857 TaxID=3259515 RepID=UPI003886B7C2
MLISSKNKNGKIILGLLSYTYDDEKANLSEMSSLLESYREDPNFDILLYKNDESENFIGLICIEKNTLESQNEDTPSSTTIIVHRIAVVPSFRDEGIGYKMYELLRKQHPNATVIGAMNTVDILAKWSTKYNQSL